MLGDSKLTTSFWMAVGIICKNERHQNTHTQVFSKLSLSGASCNSGRGSLACISHQAIVLPLCDQGENCPPTPE